MTRNKNMIGVAIGAILAGVGGDAIAQQNQGQAPGLRSIEEVVVTARRREESLQEVPVSISAIGGEDLEARNITGLREVNGQIPNVVIAPSQFAGTVGSQFRMRGVPGVVVYQDGAPLSSGSLPNFTDIERVEVLRGPQGTLFGRAAIGGAVQIVTQRPQDYFFADVSTAMGSRGRVDVSTNLNFPITDTLFAKFTAASYQQDGYVGSTNVNTKFGSQDDTMARVDLLWAPTNNFDARIQYARTDYSSSGNAYVNMNLQAVCNDSEAPNNWFSGDGVQIFDAPNAYCLYTTVDIDPVTPGVQPFDDQFHSYGALGMYLNTIDSMDTGWQQVFDDVRIDLNWDINDEISLRSISSRRWGTMSSYETLDATNLDLWVNQTNFFPDDAETTTTELQLVYTGGQFSSTTGVYWEDDPGFLNKRVNFINNKALQNQALFDAIQAAYPESVAPLPPFGNGDPESAPQLLGNGFIGLGKTDSTQMAIFSEWTWAATDALSVTLGLRYTEQENTDISYSGNFPDDALNPIPATPDDLVAGVDYYAPRPDAIPEVTKTTADQWTPRLSVQYQWNPDIMTYATYSEGATTNSGFVNVDEGDPAIIALGMSDYFTYPQEVKNYELGLRSDLFNGILRLNATAFYNDYTNIQLSEELLPGRLFAANADGEVTGIEIEGVWLATEAFSINYGMGWLDAKYTDRGTTRNLAPGTPFALTPELSYALGAQYVWNVGGGDLTLRGDYTWQDEQLSAVDRITAYPLPDYGLLNARLTYRPVAGNWDVSLSGNNLTDEYNVLSAFYQPQTTAVAATVGRPREFALHFNVRFE